MGIFDLNIEAAFIHPSLLSPEKIPNFWKPPEWLLLRSPEPTVRPQGGALTMSWVAVKELKLSYYIGETLLFTKKTHYGSLIYVP